MQIDPLHAPDWKLLPPGREMICRSPVVAPLDELLAGGYRLATLAEVVAANNGYYSPWGNLPDAKQASPLWKRHRIGIGGLHHQRWFVTSQGRVGGAANVVDEGPGALRNCLWLDGGTSLNPTCLEENEGWAVVRSTSAADQALYRQAMLYAAERIGADGGTLILSPVGDENRVYVGFGGRCMFCPNLELISLRQLAATLKQYQFELLPEWKNWSLET